MSWDADESTNHAEAGLYKSTGGEAANKARVQLYVGEAIEAWKGGKIQQSLSTLALGIHTAEDRSAHGEGKPGTGHDPRRMIPAPAGSSVNYYDSQWENAFCDMKDKNGPGYDQAIIYATQILQQFYESVKGTKQPEGSFVVKMQPASWYYPRWMEKLVRKICLAFGFQPEEVPAFLAEKLTALAKWPVEKLALLMNWSAQKLKVLATWTADKLAAIAAWSADKLAAIATWSADKLATIATWTAEKLTAIATWSVEKLTEIATWTAKKLSAIATWSVEKVRSAASWTIKKLRSFGSWLKKNTGLLVL